MIWYEWPLIRSDHGMDPMSELAYKLRSLKEKVKSWSKEENRRMKDKSAVLENEINALLSSTPSAILKKEQHEKLLLLKNGLHKFLDHEIYSAKLQSRVTWDSKGDANTKYFHVVASAWKNHNAIWSLQDERGTWVSDDLSLKALGTSYFRKIFEEENETNNVAQLRILRLFPSFISASEAETFTKPVTILEVEKALKTFKKDKVPGPDGWPVEFYLTFLDLLGPLLVNLVESSRIQGRVSPVINSTFLALIPN